VDKKGSVNNKTCEKKASLFVFFFAKCAFTVKKLFLAQKNAYRQTLLFRYIQQQTKKRKDKETVCSDSFGEIKN
jgi:hypothetical protein